MDFGLLASNSGKSASGAAVEISSADWAALDAFAATNGLISEVLEPNSVGVALVAAMGLLRCRSRRRRCQ